MNKNQITGSAREGFGRVQERFGALLGDNNIQVKGAAKQAHGTLERYVGRAADVLQTQLNRAPQGGAVQTQGQRALDFARRKPRVTTLALAAVALVLSGRGGKR